MGKYRIKVAFPREWVLTRRGDARLPIDAVTDWIAQEMPGGSNVEHASLTELRIIVSNPPSGKIQLLDSYARFLGRQYGKAAPEPLIDIEPVEAGSAPSEPEAAEPADVKPAGKPSARNARCAANDTACSSRGIDAADVDPAGDASGTDRRVTRVDAEKSPKHVTTAASTDRKDEPAAAESIAALLGAAEFKQYALALAEVAPALVRDSAQSLVAHQRCLFSIGGGCGLTTALKLLQRHLSELSLFQADGTDEPLEIRLDPPGNDPARVLDQTADLLGGKGGGRKLVCLDLEEWMDRLGGPEFRRFLRRLARLGDRHLLVFRVPFVDQDTVAAIEALIADQHMVRAISFPPLSPGDLLAYASACAEKAGFAFSEDASRAFERRMALEKSDGRFDGMNTVAKVVREMLFHFYRNRTHAGIEVPVPCPGALIRIDSADLAGFIGDDGLDEGDAMERLDAMIGLETVKARIREILAQIAYGAEHPEMARPCLHMRFVGNPGTGKTTVARLLGRLLAERGVLRNGLFFEHAGRDFCGRYIGETAPKTAGIVRDAYGSVLFIDEAYSLYRGEDDTRDYGREALDTLIAEMENHRTDLVVIMAGYPDEMETLMAGNSGLAGRMPYLVEFPNYDRAALLEIFRSMHRGRHAVGEGFEEAVAEWFAALPDSLLAARTFSNARFVRNLFERTWGKAVLRARLAGSAPLTLTRGDFLEASAEREFAALNAPRQRRLGF